MILALSRLCYIVRSFFHFHRIHFTFQQMLLSQFVHRIDYFPFSLFYSLYSLELLVLTLTEFLFPIRRPRHLLKIKRKSLLNKTAKHAWATGEKLFRNN